jgi:hypothetical protein
MSSTQNRFSGKIVPKRNLAQLKPLIIRHLRNQLICQKTRKSSMTGAACRLTALVLATKMGFCQKMSIPYLVF